MIDITKTFLSLIKKAKGRVVNFSSAAGRNDFTSNIIYFYYLDYVLVATPYIFVRGVKSSTHEHPFHQEGRRQLFHLHTVSVSMEWRRSLTL